MACFGEFRAVFLKNMWTICINIPIEILEELVLCALSVGRPHLCPGIWRCPLLTYLKRKSTYLLTYLTRKVKL